MADSRGRLKGLAGDVLVTSAPRFAATILDLLGSANEVAEFDGDSLPEGDLE